MTAAPWSVMQASIRPREGDLVYLLAEVQGTPVTHVARAGTVRDSMLFVPRRPSEPVWQ